MKPRRHAKVGDMVIIDPPLMNRRQPENNIFIARETWNSVYNSRVVDAEGNEYVVRGTRVFVGVITFAGPVAV